MNPFCRWLRRWIRLAVWAVSLGASAWGAERRVLLIAGPPSHFPGAHEYKAGMLLIQKCLAGTPGLKIEVSLGGWPADPQIFTGVAAVVLFCDGGTPHALLQGERLRQLEAALAGGGGLGLLHYATEPASVSDEETFLRLAGGCFAINRSVNPIWDADFASIPDHPILRGVQPFALRDEWYFQLRFPAGMRGVTPLLVAVPPATSMERPNGPHEGNPAARAAVARGEPQTLAWAYERPDGGRGFGFSGLHYQSDWENGNARKLLLNAVLWLAKLEVPAGGVVSRLSEADLWDNLDAKSPLAPAALRRDLGQIRADLARLEAEIGVAKKAGANSADAEISALTVRNFATWIEWDIAHPEALLRAVGHDEVSGLGKLAPRLTPQIAWQELSDCQAVLDRARTELTRRRSQSARVARSVSIPAAGALARAGSYFARNGKPVLIGGFTWAPADAEDHAAYGPIASVQITPASLASETGGMALDAIRQMRLAASGAETSGGRFDVFLGQSPPAWAVRAHPEITAGSRQFVKYDIDHPLVRAMWRQLFAQAVPMLSASPASLHTYLLSNEPSWYTSKGVWSTGTVSEFTFEKFRSWLAERYRGDVAELNRRWAAHYDGFAAVRLELPLDSVIKGSAIWYDWCRFNMDRVNAWFAFLRAEIQKSDPAALAHVKVVSEFWLTPRHERDNGIDYETLASQVEDVAGADSAPEPPYTLRRFGPIADWSERYAMGWQAETMYYDFLRSVAPDKPIYDSEYHAFSAGSWAAPHLRADYVRAVLWLGSLHGLAVNQTWYWPRREDGGLEKRSEEGFYGSIGMQPIALDAYGRTMRELNAHADEVAALAAAPRPVRIFYSTDSAIQSPTFIAAITKAYEAAYFSGSPVGFVTERMLAAASPDEMRGYPLVIIPSATHVSDGAVSQLRRYAAAGGTVVLFGAAPLERTVYGDPRPATELAFLGGSPRIAMDERVEAMGRRLAELAARAGIHPLVSCQEVGGKFPWGVRCVSVRHPRGLLVSLVNVALEARTVILKTDGGPVASAEDLVTGESLREAAVELRPLETRLLLVGSR